MQIAGVAAAAHCPVTAWPTVPQRPLRAPNLAVLDPRAVWTTPMPLFAFVLPPDLDGTAGTNRVRHEDRAPASTDLTLIDAYLRRFQRPSWSYQWHRAEIERFVLWLLFERVKPLSSADEADCHAYLRFLMRPHGRLAGPRARRNDPRWVPFGTEPVPTAERTRARKALRDMFAVLVEAGFLATDPWPAPPGVMLHRANSCILAGGATNAGAPARSDPGRSDPGGGVPGGTGSGGSGRKGGRRGHRGRRSTGNNGDGSAKPVLRGPRAIGTDVWQALAACLEEGAPGVCPRHARLALAALLLIGEGRLRRDDIAIATMGELRLESREWVLSVPRRGRRRHPVKIGIHAQAALRAHWADHSPNGAPPEEPDAYLLRLPMFEGKVPRLPRTRLAERAGDDLYTLLSDVLHGIYPTLEVRLGERTPTVHGLLQRLELLADGP